MSNENITPTNPEQTSTDKAWQKLMIQYAGTLILVLATLIIIKIILHKIW